MKKQLAFISLLAIVISICICGHMKNEQTSTETLDIKIILGSTREGRTSKKIGDALKNILDKRTDTTAEIVDLKEYDLPFLDDEIAPAQRKEINNPIIKRWSEKIQTSNAFIMVVPEYNAGYPGVLKNALDILYKEWNNKIVAFVGYSGGPSGGKSAIAQLRQVTNTLQMINIDPEINIPTAWKIFDEKGNFVNKNIESTFNNMINTIKRKIYS